MVPFAVCFGTTHSLCLFYTRSSCSLCLRTMPLERERERERERETQRGAFGWLSCRTAAEPNRKLELLERAEEQWQAAHRKYTARGKYVCRKLHKWPPWSDASSANVVGEHSERTESGHHTI